MVLHTFEVQVILIPGGSGAYKLPGAWPGVRTWGRRQECQSQPVLPCSQLSKTRNPEGTQFMILMRSCEFTLIQVRIARETSALRSKWLRFNFHLLLLDPVVSPTRLTKVLVGPTAAIHNGTRAQQQVVCKFEYPCSCLRERPEG